MTATERYGYRIVSTIETGDHAAKINVGTVLYEANPSDLDDLRPTEAEALSLGQDVLNGLDGGLAFNAARDSARVETFRVGE